MANSRVINAPSPAATESSSGRKKPNENYIARRADIFATELGLEVIPDSGTLPEIDSTARNGESVSRRRFQRGSVYLNKTKTLWLGMYSEYILDSYGVEKRARKQVVLSPATMTKRNARRLLQPHLDRVNSSLSQAARERKSATVDAFLGIWERDYLSITKPSTQSSVKSHLKRLKAAWGGRDIRQVDAGDLQRLVSTANEELSPKSISNLWGTISLVWQAAFAQKYVEATLLKPKLPPKPKKRARFFTLAEVGKIIAASVEEHAVFYWLAAESGLRAGELAGAKLTDITSDRITVSRSIWHGKEQSPKTANSLRALALSPQLTALLGEQIARQKTKGHEFLFSTSSGSPWDMNAYRKRKLLPLLTALGIKQAGFHAFRHFNVSLLDSLRVPLKTIQERAGHALTGSFTLDVYGGQPDWSRNVEAAEKAGVELARVVQEAKNSVSLTAIKEIGLPSPKREAAA
jgi:integrase